MRIKSILLQDFKCHKNLEVVFQGKNGKIKGSNGTGKSAVFDAYNWLLFEKDSKDNANFEIKPKYKGEAIPDTEPTVTAVFDNVTLRKVHQEKWTKKRGEDEKVFEGYTVSYFIDDLEVKKKDFTAKVQELFDEKYFKILSNPLFFNTQLQWTERKKILEQLAGNIDIEKILDNSKYADLKEQYKKHTEEQIKELIKQHKKTHEKNTNELPVKITTLEESIEEITVKTEDVEKIELEIKEIEKEIKTEENAGINQEILEKTKEIKKEIEEIKEIRKEKTNKVENIKKEIKNLENDIDYRSKNITDYGNKIIELEKEKKELLEEYHTEKEKEFKSDIENICPVCKQEIPTEQIEEKKEKMLESFESEKEKTLAQIKEKGLKYKEWIEKNKHTKAEEENKMLECKEKIKQLEKDLNKIVIETGNIKDESELETQLKELKEKLYTKNTDKIKELEEKRKEKVNKLVELKTKLNKAEENKKTKEYIQKLKEELKTSNENLMKIYKLENQLKDFSIEKAKLIEMSVNDLFSENINFKLFDIKQNGNIEETCICLCGKDKIEFNSHNTAGKVQVGLEIINLICNKNNLSSIVWIDNREGIIELPKTENQVISLCVVENENKIKVEVE